MSFSWIWGLDMPAISEYYDRGMPESRLLPASRAMQDEYWLLRSVLCAAIAASWTEICDGCPDVAKAALAFDSFLRAHPGRTFSVFRPEDVTLKQEAGSPMFLR